MQDDINIDPRPYCLNCDGRMNRMNRKGRINSLWFQCPRCRIYVAAHRSPYACARTVRPTLPVEARPICELCGNRKAVNGHYKGRPNFHCRHRPAKTKRVKWTAPRVPLPPLEGSDLLQLADRLLPRGLDPDIRDEAKGAIVLDLFTRKTSEQKLLNPATVRQYINAARGMSQDRYRFKSLDAPAYEDNKQTFGETLEG